MRMATHNPVAGWPLCIGFALILGLAAGETVAEPRAHTGLHAQAFGQYNGSDAQDSSPNSTQEAAQPAIESLEEALCPAARYRKNLLITQFPRREMASTNAGHLYHVEGQLPRLLGAQLNAHPAIADVRLLNASLPNNHAAGTPQHTQQVRKLARAQNVQLILSGEIIDMSMARPGDTYTPSLASRARNGLATATYLRPLDTRQRNLVFQLTLHDGITGAALQQWHYHSQGVWAPRRPHSVGFGSPQFWRTDYGKQIADTLALASTELADEISCVPLIASLDMKAGPAQIIVHSGTEQQLSTGDTLRLYQVITRPIPGAYQLHRSHLVDSQVELEIQEAHARYSMGRLSDELDVRHGHYVALSTQPGRPDGLAKTH